MEEWLDTLYGKHGLYYCVECGKCVAVCPMQDIFYRFDFEISPRGIIKKAALHSDILKDEALWFCLECSACTDACPAGVKYRDFMNDLRSLSIERGNIKNIYVCEICGRYYSPRAVLTHLKDRLHYGDSDYLSICPDCRENSFIDTIRDTFHASGPGL